MRFADSAQEFTRRQQIRLGVEMAIAAQTQKIIQAVLDAVNALVDNSSACSGSAPGLQTGDCIQSSAAGLARQSYKKDRHGKLAIHPGAPVFLFSSSMFVIPA